MSDRLDIEFLLEQWGLWSIGGLGLGLSRGAEITAIACDEKSVKLIDWAIGQIGLTNRRRKNILKHKYLTSELDDNGCSTPISDAMVSLHFRTTEDDIRAEINAAINDIDLLISETKKTKII